MKLSDKILALRKKEGMSQEDLAERLHVSRQAVSRWEMGSAQPEASNILQLSRLFGVTADYLLDDGQEVPATAIAPEGGTSPGIPGENPGMEGFCGVAAGEGGHGSRHHAADVKTGGKAKEKCRYRIIGWCAALTGLLGNFVIYVLSRMHKVMVPRITYNGAGQPTYYWSSEIMGYSYKYFVSQHRLQLLVTFFWGMAVTGLLAALLLPYIKSKAES